MVKFINHLTGTDMWVADERVEEYIGAGFRPASEPSTEAKKPTKVAPKTTKKTVAKKTTKK